MKNQILILVYAALFFACSIDAEEQMVDNATLIGTWNMKDVRFSSNALDPKLNLADEVVDFLWARNCVLASFTFNEDGTATGSNKVNHLQINAGPTGLDVPCPTQSDSESSTWKLENDQLTLSNNGQQKTIKIVFEDKDTFVISGSAVNKNNYDGADAVFVRMK